jgi:hypothetical protein
MYLKPGWQERKYIANKNLEIPFTMKAPSEMNGAFFVFFGLVNSYIICAVYVNKKTT